MTPGEAATAARALQEAVSRGVHRTVRGAGSAAGSMSGLVASRFGGSGRTAADGGGHLALAAVAALNALAGDKFGPELAPPAIELAVRADGRDIEPVTEELATAFPRPTARLAIFVHGLAETDLFWHRQAAGHLPYGPRLKAGFGYTPVYLRYNTGRHVRANGTGLADLLGRLQASWPVPVSDLLLVGHSTGGLVIRSACHYGAQACAPWTRQVRQVFYLGSPDSRLRDHRIDVPPLGRAQHHAISAMITADPGLPFPGGRGSGGPHHFDLLNHPDVWAAMRDILSRPGR